MAWRAGDCGIIGTVVIHVDRCTAWGAQESPYASFLDNQVMLAPQKAETYPFITCFALLGAHVFIFPLVYVVSKKYQWFKALTSQIDGYTFKHDQFWGPIDISFFEPCQRGFIRKLGTPNSHGLSSNLPLKHHFGLICWEPPSHTEALRGHVRAFAELRALAVRFGGPKWWRLNRSKDVWRMVLMLMLVYHSYINVIITTIVIIIAVTSNRNNNDGDDGDYGYGSDDDDDSDSDDDGGGDDDDEDGAAAADDDDGDDDDGDDDDHDEDDHDDPQSHHLYLETVKLLNVLMVFTDQYMFLQSTLRDHENSCGSKP